MPVSDKGGYAPVTDKGEYIPVSYQGGYASVIYTAVYSPNDDQGGNPSARAVGCKHEWIPKAGLSSCA